MKNRPFVVTPKNYAKSLDAVGEKITVLALRRRRKATRFSAEGRVRTRPTPGTLVHMPACTVHSFRFGAVGAQMRSVVGRAA